jgi:hypothetical protein
MRHMREAVAIAVVAVLCCGILQLVDANHALASGGFVRPKHSHPTVPPSPAASSPSTGQSNDTSLPSLPWPIPPDAPAKDMLRVGGVTAKISQIGSDTLQPVGISTFVNVTVTSASDPAAVLLRAELDGASLKAVAGRGLQAKAFPSGSDVRFKLDRNASTAIGFEIALGGVKDASDKPNGRLRLTLGTGAPGVAPDSAVLSWQVTDCAGNYYTRLQSILTDRQERMSKALERAVAFEPSIGPTWIFPRKAGAVLINGCAGRRGSKSQACAKANAPATSPDEALENKLMALAERVEAARGALQEFQRRSGALRQVSWSLLNGLRIYLQQQANPALCSGVEDMLDYYLRNTPTLRATIAEAGEALLSAKELAKRKVDAFAQAAAVTSAQGDSTAVPPSDGHEFRPDDLIRRVARLMFSTADAATLEGMEDIKPELQKVKALLDGGAAADKSEQMRAAAISALRTIEATNYLSSAYAKFHDIDESIFGTMSAISEAHKQTCICAM